MTPPPDGGGRVNPFGMQPLVDADRFNTDHIGGPGAASGPGPRHPAAPTAAAPAGGSTRAGGTGQLADAGSVDPMGDSFRDRGAAGDGDRP